MNNNLRYVIGITGAMLMAHSASLAAADTPDRRDRNERAEERERTDRAPSPYSNREQARQRRVRDAIRDARRPERGTYRFRRLEPRDPD